jgi:peptidoglycan/LPS O-acetylase OafA/YrhL
MDTGDQGEAEHIREIDALRGIAACFVAFIVHQHFILGGGRIEPFGALSFTPTIIRCGETMVDLFFVISGFVFTHVYYREASGLRGSAGSFIIARIARLYPLHIVTALAMFAMLAFGEFPGIVTPHDSYHLLLNLLMLHESGLETGISLNRAAWSISIEAYCYAAFLVAVLVCKARAPLAFVALIFGGFALFVVTPTQTTEAIARGMVGYFTGCLLYLNRESGKKLSRPFLAAMVLIPFLIDTGPVHPGFLMSMLGWPALILLAQNCPLLRNQPMQWLGDRSYSIYMLHTPVYLLVVTLLFSGERLSDDMAPFAVLLVFMLTLVGAQLSFRYFELPMRTLIKNRYHSGLRASATLLAKPS